MAEQEDRTEDVSQKKLEDAKKEGDVPRSADFAAAWIVFGAAGIFMEMAPSWGNRIIDKFMESLSFPGPSWLLDPRDLFASALRDMQTALWIFLVMGSLIILLALSGTVVTGGWVWSPEKAWDWQRISFTQGIKKPFTKKGVSALLEDVVKTAVLGAAMVAVLWGQRRTWFQLLNVTPFQAISAGLHTLGDDFLFFSALLFLPGFVDVLLQRRLFIQKLKMSKQEVRDENKELNGDPHIKGRLRQIRRKLARARMMKSVETANVVVTNPEHFSVAIRFRDDMIVPIVVAKGLDQVAFRIREIALQHGVPVLDAPSVARSLHKYCDIGDPIPSGLYEAVAIVLAYIDHLERARAGRESMPKPWAELKLGETLGRDFEQAVAGRETA